MDAPVSAAAPRPASSARSAYDAAAASFDRYRRLPDAVPQAVRAAVLAALPAPARILDLGAGTGRIGFPFVAAGDDYVGLDLSRPMLQGFLERADMDGHAPRLVQGDGARLPFAAACFDGVLLIQIFGGLRDWQRLLGETRRVLRPGGALILGRTVAPEDGIDARMKFRLASILRELGARQRQPNRREDVAHWLARAAATVTRTTVAAWQAERTPRAFIARHRSGAHFALLPEGTRRAAMDALSDFAVAAFGSLDAGASEPHYFELALYRFEPQKGFHGAEEN